MTGWRLVLQASLPLHVMSFLRHLRSIHPMGWEPPGRDRISASPRPHRLDESEPIIPRRVGLHQSPLPLHRPTSILGRSGGAVNHHGNEGGDFSSGYLPGQAKKGLPKTGRTG